jgi:methionyl-tRNA synthetase
VLLRPFLPETARGLAERLGLADEQLELAAFGSEPPVGSRVAKGPPLFPRVELPAGAP